MGRAEHGSVPLGRCLDRGLASSLEGLVQGARPGHPSCLPAMSTLSVPGKLLSRYRKPLVANSEPSDTCGPGEGTGQGSPQAGQSELDRERQPCPQGFTELPLPRRGHWEDVSGLGSIRRTLRVRVAWR